MSRGREAEVGEGAVAAAPRAGGVEGRPLLVGAALLCAGSAAGTIWWCGRMTGGMPMPGGWTMSMTWMRMPGQGWLGAAAAFVAMWVLMMAAMMLPSLVPVLSRYHRAIAGPEAGRLTTAMGAGYLAAWGILGAAVWPLGVALAAAEMRWPRLARCVPLATGVVIALAGVVQLTGWKARLLRRCRAAPGRPGPPPVGARAAGWEGLLHGARCCLCCGAFTAVLLVTGVMDLRAMALVAAAITAERLAPWPTLAARVSGALVLAAGIAAIGLAVGPA